MLLQNPMEAFSNPSADYPILGVLEKAHKPMSTTAISKRCEAVPRISAHKSLTRLSQHGILKHEMLGNTYFYEINRKHVLYEAIREILQAPKSLFDNIASDISQWNSPPLAVYLFGSAARKQMTAESDIDILFLFEHDDSNKDICLDNVYSLCEEITEKTGNTTNPVIFAQEEVKNTPLFRDILNEGVCIFGDTHILKRKLGTHGQSNTVRHSDRPRDK